MGKSPLFFILPLASGVQLAFILPVANPAMVITYASGKFSMSEWVSLNLSGRLGYILVYCIPLLLRSSNIQCGLVDLIDNQCSAPF